MSRHTLRKSVRVGFIQSAMVLMLLTIPSWGFADSSSLLHHYLQGWWDLTEASINNIGHDSAEFPRKSILPPGSHIVAFSDREVSIIRDRQKVATGQWSLYKCASKRAIVSVKFDSVDGFARHEVINSGPTYFSLEFVSWKELRAIPWHEETNMMNSLQNAPIIVLTRRDGSK